MRHRATLNKQKKSIAHWFKYIQQYIRPIFWRFWWLYCQNLHCCSSEGLRTASITTPWGVLFLISREKHSYLCLCWISFRTNVFKLKAGNKRKQEFPTTQTAGVWPLPQTSLSLRKHGASSKKYVVRLMYAYKYSDRLINNMCLYSF